jgi:CubicO group peptidase (beta-lactamase class C family)
MAIRFRRYTALAAVLLAPPAAMLTAQVPAARIDSIFTFARDTTPGCSMSAMRDGAVLYTNGYGIADFEHNAPITPGTVFYMASVSKQFTAAAINLLVLDKKLGLDDDVRKYVPEIPVYQRPITIRHLLNHTSGLRDYLELFGMAGLDDFPINNADFLAMMGRQRALNFAPGDAYSYSNSGYVLLTIVVQRITGKPIRAFAEERIFKPLGMTSTVFRDRHNMLIRNLATAYGRAPGGPWNIAVPYFDVVGDGGLMSSVSDLAKWESNWWQPQIGGAEWLTLEKERGRLSDGTIISYGAGLGHGVYRGDSTVSHGGGFGGYNTFLMRFPARRFSVAVLCNSATVPAGQLAQRVADVFLGDVLAAAPAGNGAASAAPARISLDPARMAAYTGTFFGAGTMLVRRLVVDSSRLFYSRGPGNRSELIPVAEGRFQMAGTDVLVTIPAGRETVRLDIPGDPPLVLTRVSPFAGGSLAALAGTYFSSDLRTSITVEPRDSVLLIKPERGTPTAFSPVFADAFSAGFYFLQVVRDGGRVTGVEVSGGERARRVRFEKQP